MSFKELSSRYFEFKDKTYEELCEIMEPWWAEAFLQMKDDFAVFHGDKGDKKENGE